MVRVSFWHADMHRIRLMVNKCIEWHFLFLFLGDAWNEMDFGYWILDIGYWILDIGYWILDIGYWILDIGYWILDIGYFWDGLSLSGLLVTGTENIRRVAFYLREKRGVFLSLSFSCFFFIFEFVDCGICLFLLNGFGLSFGFGLMDCMVL
ncbi:hypothetical protein BZA77DRAFT_52 [Pyronema omphalodes]|nr:hypothetical protein BZA77DRAFT_52 [Pyronema omphalodes]